MRLKLVSWTELLQLVLVTTKVRGLSSSFGSFISFCPDALQYGPFIVVFRKLQDSFLALIADEGENEGIVGDAVETIFYSMKRILEFANLPFLAMFHFHLHFQIASNDLSKRNMLARFNELALLLDAIVDNGFVFFFRFSFLFLPFLAFPDIDRSLPLIFFPSLR